METLTTQEAAEAVGVGVSKYHRLVAELDLTPAVKAPGKRGAMFWLPEQVERIKGHLASERAGTAAS